MTAKRAIAFYLLKNNNNKKEEQHTLDETVCSVFFFFSPCVIGTCSSTQRLQCVRICFYPGVSFQFAACRSSLFPSSFFFTPTCRSLFTWVCFCSLACHCFALFFQSSRHHRNSVPVEVFLFSPPSPQSCSALHKHTLTQWYSRGCVHLKKVIFHYYSDKKGKESQSLM